MEDLHIQTLHGQKIEQEFEKWKKLNPRAHVKQLHFSSYYKPGPGDDVPLDEMAINMKPFGYFIDSVLIEYTEES